MKKIAKKMSLNRETLRHLNGGYEPFNPINPIDDPSRFLTECPVSKPDISRTNCA